MGSNEKKNVVFIGDSITDGGTFPSILETYFTINNSLNNYNFVNIGVSAETLSGLTEPLNPGVRPCVFDRLDRIIEITKPDIAIVFYGVNDGIYHPFSEERFHAFKNGVAKIVDKLHGAGSKVVLLTPTPYDHLSTTGNLLGENDEGFGFEGVYEFYDDVLAEYALWIKTCNLADCVVDVRTALKEAFEEKRITQPKFVSGDGIHYNMFGNYIIAKTIGRELFNVNLTMNKNSEFARIYHLVLKKNIMLHKNLKETVGHTSVFKDKYLPNDKLEKAVNKIQKKIDKTIFRGKLTQKHSFYHDFNRYDFEFNGFTATVVMSDNPTGKWIWRTRFLGAFDQADVEMIKNGYYLVYWDLKQMYGCPRSVQLLKEFYDYIVSLYNLNEKATIFGFSRGGLYAIGFAVKYPHCVDVLYLDAPVVDLFSWPKGDGKSCGSGSDWARCKKYLNLTEKSKHKYQITLHDKLKKLASLKIPLILVAGDSDKVVPYDENGARLIQEYEKSQATYKLLLKEGEDHHPHSLKDPKEIVDFILTNREN